MKIYVKSAGFSIDQDYSWIDEAGKNITPDASILAYNVSDIQFVWKSTSGSIYLFCNAFTDPNRTDLYNRPLRNYMLLTGNTEEAAACKMQAGTPKQGFAWISKNLAHISIPLFLTVYMHKS